MKPSAFSTSQPRPNFALLKHRQVVWLFFFLSIDNVTKTAAAGLEDNDEKNPGASGNEHDDLFTVDHTIDESLKSFVEHLFSSKSPIPLQNNPAA
ncbi:hypothetical protein G7K_5604-t1 [Saitoella complicata NRRL Y-17804]|uniref:Uncharacterized protein n=1 Tax=Saitoella complicata (strain BCRC 22490 / CBS 7301 / JCM 7358 / NBRC 10748 / NRRL Y-17804) TaxID=698492 RepID=A0A0E9NQ02_SAICN|nr:hypothetical protein G7K_5604-t1 [Saitoella complicata NRRL Y-17804]